MKPIILILSFFSLLFANLPPQITYNENNQSLVIEYENGSVVEYSYDGIGNITEIVTPTQTITKTYDALNRLSTVTAPQGHFLAGSQHTQGTVTYSYDALGRQTQITFANGVTTHYTYDVRNRITNIEHSNSNGDILQSFTYTLDAVGNRTQIVENSVLPEFSTICVLLPTASSV